MTITFVLADATMSAKDIYVTFAAAAASLVYGTENITFASGAITIDKKSYGTSRGYSLADIIKNGLVLNSATSLEIYFSYGSKENIELLAVGSQPGIFGTSTPRYSQVEISYSGSGGGGGIDLTNISQFGGSLQVALLSSGTVQCQVANTLDTTAMFRALAATSGFSGTQSTTAVLLDWNGKFLRVIGTNVFPDGTTPNSYPAFNAYLQSLYTTYGATSFLTGLTNLAPGQSPGGTGAVGYMSAAGATNVTPSVIYNLDYHFTGVITQVTAPGAGNPNGTYSVQLTGYVNATLAAPQPGQIKSYQYTGLSINIAADDLTTGNMYMTNFLYTSSTSAAGTNVTSAGWDALNNDFGAANMSAAMLLKAAGDFAQGMLCGFPGSGTASDSTPGSNLGQLTSYEWWQNPLLAYQPAQGTNPYYSAFGNAVHANSSVNNNGVTAQVGGVYGSPYDDRFNLNLLVPTASTDEMQITLLSDGDLKPKS